METDISGQDGDRAGAEVQAGPHQAGEGRRPVSRGRPHLRRELLLHLLHGEVLGLHRLAQAGGQRVLVPPPGGQAQVRGRSGAGDHRRTLQDTGDIQERRVLLHSARGGRRCPPPLCGEGHLVQSGSDGADWHLVSVLSFWLSDYRRQPIPSVWSPVSACPRSLGISSQPQQKHKYYNFSHIWLEILSIKYILVSRQN